MPEIRKKIELLQKIAHQFNEANIEWALGASMLLYFKGIISEFHDNLIVKRIIMQGISCVKNQLLQKTAWVANKDRSMVFPVLQKQICLMPPSLPIRRRLLSNVS